MGGDEFVIVQATIADPAEATSLAQGVIDALSEPYDIDGQQAVIGVSIGISVGPGDGSSPDKLLRNADLALYRAKSDGRGTFRFFEPAMDLQMQTRRIMEQDLRKALPARRVRAALPAGRQPGEQGNQRLRSPDTLESSDQGVDLAGRPSSRWPKRSASSSRWASGSSGRPAPPPRNGPTTFTSPSTFRRSSFAAPA